PGDVLRDWRRNRQLDTESGDRRYQSRVVRTQVADAPKGDIALQRQRNLAQSLIEGSQRGDTGGRQGVERRQKESHLLAQTLDKRRQPRFDDLAITLTAAPQPQRERSAFDAVGRERRPPDLTCARGAIPQLRVERVQLALIPLCRYLERRSDTRH